MTGIIDRFEERYAVIELALGEYIYINKNIMPVCREGDAIVISGGKITVDTKKTEQLHKRASDRLHSLFKN